MVVRERSHLAGLVRSQTSSTGQPFYASRRYRNRNGSDSIDLGQTPLLSSGRSKRKEAVFGGEYSMHVGDAIMYPDMRLHKGSRCE